MKKYISEEKEITLTEITPEFKELEKYKGKKTVVFPIYGVNTFKKKLDK